MFSEYIAEVILIVMSVEISLLSGHGWARDSKLTDNHWSDTDFMFHAWKASELNSTWFDANVFNKIPEPDECGRGFGGLLITKAKYNELFRLELDTRKTCLN